ncbi:MAG: hypothetical protein ACI379_04500 [Nocardioides sp.]|uniref:hypothetical protein n=1 Tax=Nocardioides sp. TaxID=35761 RepID=UPI003EFCB45A
MTRRRPALTALLLLPALAACGEDAPEPVEPETHLVEYAAAADWPQVDEPRPSTGLAFLERGEAHLADGTTIRTGPAREFTLAGTGVWFVDDGDDTLAYATADGVTEFDVTPLPGTLRSSVDGRYLAFLHRPTDVAVAVVVDLGTGQEVVSSSRGMGDPDDDLEDLYEDATPEVLGVVDGEAFVATPSETLRYDLGTGVVSVDERAAEGTEWYRAAYPDDAASNPAGTWSYDPRAAYVDALLVSDEVEVAPHVTGPDAALGDYVIDLRGWLDDRTAVGIASNLDLGVDALVTCRVPSGACTPLSGFGTVLVPNDVETSPTLVRRS